MTGGGLTSEAVKVDVETELWELRLTRLIRRSPEVLRAAREDFGGDEEDTGAAASKADAPIVQPMKIPEPSTRLARFLVLQKWEGRVLEVAEETFTASLTDLQESGYEEEAEFDVSEVTPDDRSLVRPGAVFYWNIGYRIDPSGERSRSSVLWFRRLPMWSERDIDRAVARGRQLRGRVLR